MLTMMLTMLMTMMRKSLTLCSRRSGCHLTARRYYNAADSHLLLLLLCITIQKMCTGFLLFSITFHHPLNVNHNYYYFYNDSENVYMVVIIMRGSIHDSFTAFVTYTAKERAKNFHCTPQMHPCPR